MKVKKSEVFRLLNAWRDEGLFNMYESPTHLQKIYPIDKRQARDLFIQWTKVFNLAGDYDKYDEEEELE